MRSRTTNAYLVIVAHNCTDLYAATTMHARTNIILIIIDTNILTSTDTNTKATKDMNPNTDTSNTTRTSADANPDA